MIKLSVLEKKLINDVSKLCKEKQLNIIFKPNGDYEITNDRKVRWDSDLY